MPTLPLTAALRREYETLFCMCQLRPEARPDVDSLVDALLAHQAAYREVESKTHVPWFLVAAIHTMESSQAFDRHLHNGDPLTDRTTHVPAGRPAQGTPPFRWQESAIDALTFKQLHRRRDWSLGASLFVLERYNGWGYRLYHPEVKSPYLWSLSNHYSSGKYVADGRWSDSAVSRQCGAAVLLRRMVERGEVAFQITPPATPLRFSPTQVLPDAIMFQRFLNEFDWIHLREDGLLGTRSSDACHSVLGTYLKGDPRDQDQ